jgi:hypothetical protein
MILELITVLVVAAICTGIGMLGACVLVFMGRVN